MMGRIRQLFCVAVICWSVVRGLSAFAQDSDPAVVEGRDLYISYGCAVCHGPDGDGKGLVPVLSAIAPTNFTDLKAYRFGTDKNAIQHSIKFGIKEEGAVMPAFGHIPEEELNKISDFLISLRRK